MMSAKDDITARFDWIGKSKEELKKEQQEKGPEEKEPMPTFLDFVWRNYYYEVVKIDIGEGYKIMRENIRSSWKDLDGQTALGVVKVPLPCGMMLEQVENENGRIPGVIQVAEIYPGGNADKAGIKVGDAFRACNAIVSKKVSDATAFIEADTKKTRAFLIADGQDVEKVIGAIQSNTEEGYVTMIFERKRS